MASTEINEVIFNEAIQIGLDLARLDASTQNEVLALLKQMQKDLITSLGNDDLTTWGRRRLNQQLKESQQIIASYYSDIEAITLASTSGIAPIVSTSVANALAVAVGNGAGGAVAGIIPTTNYMEALASNAIVEGATQKEWWARQSDEMAFRFKQAVKTGLVNAETNSQIIKRVLDIEGITTRNVEKLVRTSVMTISNMARQKTFEQNEDVISSLEWSSALDSRTCAECAPRDGLRWDIKTKKPIGHKVPFSSPPKHLNCRCSLIPITKTFRELGFDIDEVDLSARASMEGVVTDKNFNAFMDRNGKTFTDEVLGKGRSELYRKGIITLEQLIDGKGNLLTLKQLQNNYL